MANRQNAEAPELIKYLVQRHPTDFVIEIPANWKLTFGAVNPGNGNIGRHDLHCLRIYEGEKLRAVFCDVRGFRDLSLSMAIKIQTETGSASWTRDDAGNFEGSEKRAIESSYIEDPADIPF